MRMPAEKQPTTAPTGADPLEYVRTLEAPRRRAHGELLLELYGRATGEPPVMWGESMVGYGSCDYTYASGWSGTVFRAGFRPGRAKISLYDLPSHEAAPELWEKLGKHSRGASCTYINKPEDIDLDVLTQLIRVGWEGGDGGC